MIEIITDSIERGKIEITESNESVKNPKMHFLAHKAGMDNID